MRTGIPICCWLEQRQGPGSSDAQGALPLTRPCRDPKCLTEKPCETTESGPLGPSVCTMKGHNLPHRKAVTVTYDVPGFRVGA